MSHTHHSTADSDRLTDGEATQPPPSHGAWTRTTGRDLVAEFVVTHHADHPHGVPHSAVVTHLLREYDRDPDKVQYAIAAALDSGHIHAPDEPNHYRPTPTAAPDTAHQ